MIEAGDLAADGFGDDRYARTLSPGVRSVMPLISVYAHEDSRDELDELAHEQADKHGADVQDVLEILESLPLHEVEARIDTDARQIVEVVIGRRRFVPAGQ